MGWGRLTLWLPGSARRPRGLELRARIKSDYHSKNSPDVAQTCGSLTNDRDDRMNSVRRGRNRLALLNEPTERNKGLERGFANQFICTVRFRGVKKVKGASRPIRNAVLRVRPSHVFRFAPAAICNQCNQLCLAAAVSQVQVFSPNKGGNFIIRVLRSRAKLSNYKN